MKNEFFYDFVQKEKTPEDVIKCYTGRVPEEILEVWKQYGFGYILNGYLKVVNPNDYQTILEEVYLRNEGAIVLFTTAMADIIVWEDNRYLSLLNFKKGMASCISAGFDFFFEDLGDEAFKNKALDWSPYPKAVKKYGVPKYDECFGYEPILGLGGSEKVDNLKKVKLVEHIYLIKEFMGPIE